MSETKQYSCDAPGCAAKANVAEGRFYGTFCYEAPPGWFIVMVEKKLDPDVTRLRHVAGHIGSEPRREHVYHHACNFMHAAMVCEGLGLRLKGGVFAVTEDP